jgi:DNA-binding NarL/FixJ family response regulator
MSYKKESILIVDDQPLFRERLSQLINSELDMEVCGELESVEQAISLIRITSPHLAIANVTVQGLSGLDLIKSLKALSIDVPVLVLSPHDDSSYAERALRAGATGYITKHQPASEFLFALRRVLAGEVYLSEKMRLFLLKRIVTTGVKSVGREVDRLAARELDVLALSGRGRTTREIAEVLQLRMATVGTYRARIKEKMKFRNTEEFHTEAEIMHYYCSSTTPAHAWRKLRS